MATAAGAGAKGDGLRGGRGSGGRADRRRPLPEGPPHDGESDDPHQGGAPERPAQGNARAGRARDGSRPGGGCVAQGGLGRKGPAGPGRGHQHRGGDEVLERRRGRLQDRLLVGGGRPENERRVGLVGRREGGREDERLLVGRGPGRVECGRKRRSYSGKGHRRLLEGRHLQAHRLLVAETGEPGAEAVLEVLHEGARRLVSVLRLLGQDLVEDLAPLLRHEAVHLEVGRLDRVDVDELVEDRGDVGAGEGLHPREHLEGARRRARRCRCGRRASPPWPARGTCRTASRAAPPSG